MENPFEIIFNQLVIISELLQKLLLQERQTINTSEREYLNIKEASELIFLAVPTIYGLVSKREIPHFKRGKKLYFSRPDLITWLNQGRRRTINEISIEAENNLLARKSKKRL